MNFKTVATYFANCYWNHLHKTAMLLFSEEKAEDEKKAYQLAVNTYVKAFCKVPGAQQAENMYYFQILEDIVKQNNLYAENNDQYRKHDYRSFVHALSTDVLGAKDDVNFTTREKIARTLLVNALTKFSKIVLDSDDVLITSIRNDKIQAGNCIVRWRDTFASILDKERNAIGSVISARSNGVEIREDDHDLCAKKIQDLTSIVEKAKLEIIKLREENTKLREVGLKLKEYITRMASKPAPVAAKPSYYSGYRPRESREVTESVVGTTHPNPVIHSRESEASFSEELDLVNSE